MNTTLTIMLIAHVLIAVSIILLVLLQRGKGAEAGAGFGAGASGTVFGSKGSANFLTRMTAVLATLFFASSLALAYVGAQRKPPESLLESTVVDAPAMTPAAEDNSRIDIDELPALPAEGGVGQDEAFEPEGAQPAE